MGGGGEAAGEKNSVGENKNGGKEKGGYCINNRIIDMHHENPFPYSYSP